MENNPLDHYLVTLKLLKAVNKTELFSRADLELANFSQCHLFAVSQTKQTKVVTCKHSFVCFNQKIVFLAL